MKRAITWFLLLSPLFAGVLASELEARAGGGGGYSGGGGGGGDGAGAIVYLLIRLLIVLWVEGGVVGKIACVVIIAGVIWFLVWRSKQKKKEQQRRDQAGRLMHSRQQQRKQAAGVSLLKQLDPNFSRVLFIDFAHLVYVKFHESRGGLARRNPEQFGVAPYLSPTVRDQVKAADVKVTEVVVGALHLERVSASREHVHVAVRIKANVVENSRRIYLLQRLNFRRPKGITTRPPERVLELGCPNCGSPEEPAVDGRCPSCGSVTGRGEMDWQVVSVETLDRREVGPPIGHEGGEEIGTSDSTRFAPDLAAQNRALSMRDPGFSWQAFNLRLQHMFKEIQAGWSALDESRLRPYETDTVFDAHRFWLQRYRETGTRNILADVRILKIEIAKIEHDVYFDAITTRIFASMKDSTVDAAGKLISGSSSADRRFSEYWTLIRRSNIQRRSGDPKNCPNCGAPLDKINMAGVCGYCGGKLVTGEFDWVLAIIEQDEEYTG